MARVAHFGNDAWFRELNMGRCCVSRDGKEQGELCLEGIVVWCGVSGVRIYDPPFVGVASIPVDIVESLIHGRRRRVALVNEQPRCHEAMRDNSSVLKAAPSNPTP